MQRVRCGAAVGSGVAGLVARWLTYPQPFLTLAAWQGAMLVLLLFINLPVHQDRLAALDAARLAP